jgi:hypothetical protein
MAARKVLRPEMIEGVEASEDERRRLALSINLHEAHVPADILPDLKGLGDVHSALKAGGPGVADALLSKMPAPAKRRASVILKAAAAALEVGGAHFDSMKGGIDETFGGVTFTVGGRPLASVSLRRPDERTPEQRLGGLMNELGPEGIGPDQLLRGRFPEADAAVRRSIRNMDPEIARLEDAIAGHFFRALRLHEPGESHLWEPAKKQLYRYDGPPRDWGEIAGRPSADGRYGAGLLEFWTPIKGEPVVDDRLLGNEREKSLAYQGQIETGNGSIQAWTVNEHPRVFQRLRDANPGWNYIGDASAAVKDLKEPADMERFIIEYADYVDRIGTYRVEQGLAHMPDLDRNPDAAAPETAYIIGQSCSRQRNLGQPADEKRWLSALVAAHPGLGTKARPEDLEKAFYAGVREGMEIK